MSDPSGARNIYQNILHLMEMRQWRAADDAARLLLQRHPQWPVGWRVSSQIALNTGRATEALTSIDQALVLDPSDYLSWIQQARCFLAQGLLLDARSSAAAAQSRAPLDADVWSNIGGLFNQAGDQERSMIAYDRAVSLAPGSAESLYNRAAARRFVGQFVEAEEDYDRVIALRPRDYEAYLNRSELRTQTAQRNHVLELQSLLNEKLPDWRGEVQLRYALAKELEDLGDYAQSFQQLQLGARRRREHLQYDIETDVSTVGWIKTAYPEMASSRATIPHAIDKSRGITPIFIVGLPRSGTTLVERILCSHSSVHAAGELHCFAAELADAVRKRSGPGKLSRQEFVAQSATIDFPAVGADYLSCARVARVIPAAARFTDKMPLNYLYCGLIRRALPDATLVHVTRHPIAVCYAMYKTLFRTGYPFSYQLSEIGRYYLAYRSLMKHWEEYMPGQLYQMNYENLVLNQVDATRDLLGFCDLPWDDACVEFHRNKSAVTTASAVQVRRPIYDTAISQWRHYAGELSPLRRQLESAGVDCD